MFAKSPARLPELCLLLTLLVASLGASAKDTSAIEVQLSLPKLEANPYHKPFVAVWLETPDRQPLQTLAVWYDDAEWLKDLRQWWRKLGRLQYSQNQLDGTDGISGATQKPGRYTITGQAPKDLNAVLINIEVVREEGDRSYLRETLDLSQSGHYTLAGNGEIEGVSITVKP